MKLKRRENEAGFTLIELIMVIVILGIISAVAIPKYINLSYSAKLSAARGVGSAVTATIQAEHSDWLINAATYSITDIISGTSFTGGITAIAANDAPSPGEVCANTGGTDILLNLTATTFGWDWTPATGDTPALITEDTGTAF